MTESIKKKVLLIADKPSHYRVDLYNLLAETLQNNLSFYFVMDPRFSERNIISVFDGELFHNYAFYLKDRRKWERGIRFVLDIIRNKPDIIINIGLSLRMLFLVFYAKFFKRKLIVWWGGTKESEKNISVLKTYYRKFIVHFIDGAILYSELAKEYLLSINKKMKNLLVLGNNTLDSSNYLENVSLERRKSTSEKNDKLNILTVGFLIKRKNIITLLKVYKNIRQKTANVQLTILGKGPELDTLKQYSLENNIQDVFFKGFVPHNEMPRYYAMADIYVHPALYDQWPQTCNEAASSGIPIIVSNTSGYFNEYVNKHENYVLFEPRDEKQLENILRELIVNESLRKELGQSALEDALKNDCKNVTLRLIEYLTAISQSL